MGLSIRFSENSEMESCPAALRSARDQFVDVRVRERFRGPFMSMQLCSRLLLIALTRIWLRVKLLTLCIATST